MRIEVIKTIKQRETVEVELPYYYKHDLLLDDEDSIFYGKVDEHAWTVIRVVRPFGGGLAREFELSINRSPKAACGLGDYLSKEFASTEQEFLAAKAEMLQAISSI